MFDLHRHIRFERPERIHHPLNRVMAREIFQSRCVSFSSVHYANVCDNTSLSIIVLICPRRQSIDNAGDHSALLFWKESRHDICSRLVARIRKDSCSLTVTVIWPPQIRCASAGSNTVHDTPQITTKINKST